MAPRSDATTKTPTAAPYDALAHIYDAVTGKEGFEGLSPAYETLLKRAEIPPGKVLDVACGTGLWASRLLDLGWQVVGVDCCEAMVDRAKKRCQSRASFFLQDMRELDLEDKGFDLLTCTYDSLNYLTSESEVEKTLRAFLKHIKPGGRVIFDTNTTAALCDVWGTKPRVMRSAGSVCIMDTRWNRRQKTNTLTVEIFRPEKRGSSLYTRHLEVHVERSLDPEPVCRIGRQAGFETVDAWDLATLKKADRNSIRALFVAQKG